MKFIEQCILQFILLYWFYVLTEIYGVTRAIIRFLEISNLMPNI